MDVDQDFVDQVLRIARRMIADPAVSDEVTQRVVVKYRGMLLDAFITTVVRHAFADYLREQNRQTPLSQLSAPQQARVQQLTGQVEAHEKERAQVRARVESIMGRLEGLDLT